MTLASNVSKPASYLREIDIPTDLTITNMTVAYKQGDCNHSGSWVWWAFEDVMGMIMAEEAADQQGLTLNKSA